MGSQGWTCQRVRKGVKCGCLNPSRKQLCRACGGRKRSRAPKHMAVLRSTTYEECIARFGEACGICGGGPGTRRLHRDHDHRTGVVRGLLCFRCNAALRVYMTTEWLRAALSYLERAAHDNAA